jgi:hypothetical protein
MKVNDLLLGVPEDIPALPDAENPFLHADALVDAQITRIIVDVLGGAVGVLLELRRSTRLRGNTALLRVTGVAQQNWIGSTTANEFTAWSITGATVHQTSHEVHVTAQCLPVGTLRIVGTAADFTLLWAHALDAAPDFRAGARDLVRFGIANESTECDPVGAVHTRTAA